MMEETALWEGLENNKEETFKTIYINFYPTLFRYGRKITYDDDLVRDAIQELFLSLYERKSAFNRQQPLRFFLLSALRNKLMDHLKRKANHSLTLFEDEVSTLAEDSIVDAMIFIEDEQQTEQQIKRAMAILSERQREALHLRYYEELSPQQRGLHRLSGLIKLASIVVASTLYLMILPMPIRWLKRL
jgi:RNA polymerase sigma factor (sigma-70 family)